MSVEIARGGPQDLDALRPLWEALRAHHAAVAPSFGPLRELEEGWAMRRRDYAAILEEGGVLFLARDGDALVGHAICEAGAGHSATWPYPETSLSVIDFVLLPAARGAGAGERLMAAVEGEARRRGAVALDLVVAGPNAGARRFYERLGFADDLVTYRKAL